MGRLFSIRPSLSLKGRKFKGLRGFSGKPSHPPLTDFPIVAYVLAAVFDVVSYAAYSGDEASTVARDFFRSGTHVIIAGALVSLPTALTGFWDWLRSTPGGTQVWRTANWHMAVMITVTLIVLVDIIIRLSGWHDDHATLSVAALSVVAGVLVAFGAIYGGALVYEWAFNVEQDFGHGYEESTADRMPGEG